VVTKPYTECLTVMLVVLVIGCISLFTSSFEKDECIIKGAGHVPATFVTFHSNCPPADSHLPFNPWSQTRLSESSENTWSSTTG